MGASKQDWMCDPPETRYKVVAVEPHKELLFKRVNDPHRYDKLHLLTLMVSLGPVLDCCKQSHY